MSDSADLENLYVRARKYAQCSAFPDVADDFAGWLVMKVLEGKAKNQRMKQSFIDFVRSQWGYSRCETAYENTHLSWKMLMEEKCQPVEPLLVDPSRVLSGERLLMWRLYVDHEWRLKEIGDAIGKSEVWISMCIKECRELLRPLYAPKEEQPEFET